MSNRYRDYKKRLASGGSVETHVVSPEAGLHHQNPDGGVLVGDNLVEGKETIIEELNGLPAYVIPGDVDGEKSMKDFTIASNGKIKFSKDSLSTAYNKRKNANKSNLREGSDTYSKPTEENLIAEYKEKTELLKKLQTIKDIEKTVREDAIAAYGGKLSNNLKGKVSMPNNVLANGGIIAGPSVSNVKQPYRIYGQNRGGMANIMSRGGNPYALNTNDFVSELDPRILAPQPDVYREYPGTNDSGIWVGNNDDSKYQMLFNQERKERKNPDKIKPYDDEFYLTNGLNMVNNYHAEYDYMRRRLPESLAPSPMGPLTEKNTEGTTPYISPFSFNVNEFVTPNQFNDADISNPLTPFNPNDYTNSLGIEDLPGTAKNNTLNNFNIDDAAMLAGQPSKYQNSNPVDFTLDDAAKYGINPTDNNINITENPEIPVDGNSQSGWMDGVAMASQMAGPISQFFQRKPRPNNFQQIAAQNVDPTRALQIAANSANEAQALAGYGIKTNAPSSGSYMANMRALGANNRGKDIANIQFQYDDANARINNTVAAQNAEIANASKVADSQDEGAYQTERTNALYNAGANIAGISSDMDKNQIDKIIAKNIGTTNYTYSSDGQSIIYRKPNGTLGTKKITDIT